MRLPRGGSADGPALVSALLLAAAAPPSPLPLLVLGALAPLLRALADLPPGAVGRRAALRAGVVHGAAYWALVLIWVPQAGLRVGPWIVLGYGAMVGTLSLLAGGAAVLAHGLVTRRGVGLPMAAGLAWAGVEWIRGSALGPVSFPWMGLALPLAATPSLIQGAAWVGELGVAAGVAAVNGVLAGALGGARRGAARLAAVAVGIALVAGAGALRMDRAPVRTTRSVLVLQPDVALAVKRGDPEEALAASLDALEVRVRAAERGPPVDLVVLPETAVPATLDGPDAGPVRARVAAWSRRLGAPVVVGAWGAGEGRGGNAVFVATGDPREVWPSAWKVRLVPGVEWTPGFADAVQAGRPRVLPAAGIRLAPLVCIESAGARPARTLARGGADLLVNVTNDAWLGEAPWWTRSAAFHQHPAHLAFRSVETGLGGVRAANNGRSELVDPFGRRTLLVAPHRAGAGRGVAERLAEPTVFVGFGGWVGPGLAAAGLLLLLLPARSGAPPVDPTPGL